MNYQNRKWVSYASRGAVAKSVNSYREEHPHRKTPRCLGENQNWKIYLFPWRKAAKRWRMTDVSFALLPLPLPEHGSSFKLLKTWVLRGTQHSKPVPQSPIWRNRLALLSLTHRKDKQRKGFHRLPIQSQNETEKGKSVLIFSLGILNNNGFQREAGKKKSAPYCGKISGSVAFAVAYFIFKKWNETYPVKFDIN